jgi:hypothetical protein
MKVSWSNVPRAAKAMDMHNPEIVKIDRRIFGILAEYLAIDSLVAIPSLSAYSSDFDFGPRKWDTMPCNAGKVRSKIKPNPVTPARRDLESDSSILVVPSCPVLSCPTIVLVNGGNCSFLNRTLKLLERSDVLNGVSPVSGVFSDGSINSRNEPVLVREKYLGGASVTSRNCLSHRRRN